MDIRHPYSRPLNDNDLVQQFLETVLQYPDADEKLFSDIIAGEAALSNIGENAETLTSTRFRSREYKGEAQRWHLRSRIVQELFNETRLEKDDAIRLGAGGAKPNSEVQKNAQAFIVIGLPASGKSGVTAQIADKYGAYTIDSDYAKRKLPEFEASAAGASLVHEESDCIVSAFSGKKPDDFKTLFELCAREKINIVTPKIGHSVEKIEGFAIGLKNWGYDVHITLVSLDRRKATLRALKRFIDTERYVPLSLVFDGYGNDPILTYYRLKNKYWDKKGLISSFGKLSTDVEKGQPNIVVDYMPENPVCIFR